LNLICLISKHMINMSNIDNIITKIISGNSSPEDQKELTIWLNKSEENKLYFEEQKKLWNIIEKKEINFEINTEKAWEKFNLSKDSQIQEKERRYIFLKIAAVFIVLLSSTLLLFLFADKNQTKQLSENRKIEQKQTKSNVEKNAVYLSENSSPLVHKFYPKRRDTVFNKEIILPDSSIAIISKESKINLIDFNKSETRIASLFGAGMFDIKPKDKDFVLETEELKIIVQGTKFNIQEIDDKNNLIEISVEDGYMEVFEKENLNNSVKISSNEKYVYNTLDKTFTKISSPKKRFFKRMFRGRE
jgi:transmembrane sensor